MMTNCQANGGKLPRTASDMGKMATLDVPIAPDVANGMAL